MLIKSKNDFLCGTMIAGIDEAGRGCVIGPLFLAMAMSDREIADPEVRDSKLLSPGKREKLFAKYRRRSKQRIIKLMPKELDRKNLNTLELESMCELLEQARDNGVEKVFVDSPFRDLEKKKLLLEKHARCEVVLEHKADLRYPIVSLASIIAKVTRDREIERIKKSIGYDLGSGYPADPKTVEFLKTFPSSQWNGMVRKKWKTVKELAQRRLDEF